MTRFVRLILTGAMILSLAFVAKATFFTTNAQTGSKHKKKPTLSHRIKTGRHSGSLTKKETRDLKSETRELRDARRESRADGRVTHREKLYLKAKRRHTSRDIYAAKHNHKKQPRKKAH